MTGPGTNTYVVGDEARRRHRPRSARRRAPRRRARRHRADGASPRSRHAPPPRPRARRADARDAVDAPVVGPRPPARSPSTWPRREGTELAAGSLGLVAWHTPGHASDHLCFFVPATGWLFTGDHLMQGSTVVIRPPDGDLTAYLASVARVRDDRRVRRLAPGHGRCSRPPRRSPRTSSSTAAPAPRSCSTSWARTVRSALPSCAFRLPRRRPRARRGGDGDVLGAPARPRRRRPRDDRRGSLRPAAVFRARAPSPDGALHRVEQPRGASAARRGRREVRPRPRGEFGEDLAATGRSASATGGPRRASAPSAGSNGTWASSSTPSCSASRARRPAPNSS